MGAGSKKRGLGRGLDALFQEDNNVENTSSVGDVVEQAAVASTPSKGQRKLPVANLEPGKFQPRSYFDPKAIDQLAESIAAHGVLQPLLVRPIKGDGDSSRGRAEHGAVAQQKYEIIAGERRWRASQQAQLHEVPVVIQELTDQEALEIALIENLQRQDLNPLEEAEGYKRLMDEFGYSQDNMAKQLGKSRSHVANMVRLLKLPDPIKGYLIGEELSAGHARALLSANDPVPLAREILRKGLNVRQTEKLVAQENGTVKKQSSGKSGSKNSMPAEKSVDTLALEKELSNLLGMNVTIEVKGSGGAITVDYSDLDQLDEILQRLSVK